MKNDHPVWIRLLIPLTVMVLFTALIIMERRGVSVTDEINESIDLDAMTFTSAVTQEAECLVIVNEEEEDFVKIREEVLFVLSEMCVAYDVVDVQDFTGDLNDYRNVILAIEDWDQLGTEGEALSPYLEQGGNLLNVITPSPGKLFQALSQKMGINTFGDFTSIEGIRIETDRIIGTDVQSEFPFSIEEGESMDVSLEIRLDDSAEVYITSLDGRVPLIWENQVNEGSFVVMNYTITEKFQRAFYSFAYSLLQDVEVYPVINASSFFLDDFPSPTPGGDSQYILRDYGIDTASFYLNVWFPRVLEWEQNYGIKHTAVMIEDYDDQVEGVFERNESTGRFVSYGTIVLNNGGEIGYHGYNHQPLAIEGIDDEWQYGDYKLWPSTDDIYNAITELTEFGEELFPAQTLQVYVPPSNIMSDTGLETLLRANPDIRVIASIYLTSEAERSYVQEFDVDENGVVNTPRITSGCDIDDYMYLTAFAEMNYHFVQAHFLHPDDVLDPDRGAEAGWDAMATNFEEYLDFVTSVAPSMEMTTGSEAARRVKLFDQLSIQKTREEGHLTLDLGGFSEEAYLMVRINTEQLTEITGGEATEVAENLYLVHATSDHVEINYR